tara:strand:- start:634 stop:1005 length:372 start_codon:yes stop_codon:yes gene_type:complete
MKLTENFSLSEFTCNSGAEFPIELMENVKLLAEQLQVLRDFLCVPIKINSGYRTESHNKKVGGVKNSQHRTATAADIVVRGVPADLVQKTIKQLINDGKMKEGGLGCYLTFTHYDIRSKKARW